ncbi:Nucleic-acid-binding protein from transposon X-element [Eumeta japonica]|uniref:Nucleic-acid-binding protein from transposon X-element n=1 Tax=Eumeta variegata TaxID=151549 RepID=A0A4C1YSZ3_EUMVA|nr:Nucleic-acid-binding protein from transposon X-element [Eumeta japonica]
MYCASLASPDALDTVFDLDMEVEYNPVKEPSKRSAALRPSEDSTSDSDPGWSDISDHSDFTTLRARKTSRTKPEGLKLQAKTVADFRNLQNLLVTQSYVFHTYSLKEEREIRVVLRGVLRDIPVDAVKEDLHAQNLSVRSVRRILNRFREPLDLILVSGTAEANVKATKAAFFEMRSVCSLSGIKAEQSRKRALPGQCHNCQSYGYSPRHCFNPARCAG